MFFEGEKVENRRFFVAEKRIFHIYFSKKTIVCYNFFSFR